MQTFFSLKCENIFSSCFTSSLFALLNSWVICSVFVPLTDLFWPVKASWVSVTLVYIIERVSRTVKWYRGSYFSLRPVSLLLQYSIMQCGPGCYISVSQIVSDDVPAEGPVVVESSIKHDVACSSETVGQLVGITCLTWAGTTHRKQTYSWSGSRPTTINL